MMFGSVLVQLVSSLDCTGYLGMLRANERGLPDMMP